MVLLHSLYWSCFPLYPTEKASQSEQLIKQHIKQQGSLGLRSVRTLFIGPARVGKTSTKKNLIGQRSPSVVSPSTVIDKPVTVPVYAAAQSETVLGWKPQDLQEQVQTIFNHILASQDSPSSSSTAGSATQASQSLAGNPATHVRGSSTVTRSKQEKATPTQEKTTPTQAAAADYVMDQLSPYMSRGDWQTVRGKLKEIEDVTFLQLIDVGGQPELHEVLPLLLHGQALNLLFFRLDKELDEAYQVTFASEGGGQCPVKYQSESTIKNILQLILSSIASLRSKKNLSPALLVGTHFDQVDRDTLHAREESIQEAFKDADIFRNILQPVRYDSERDRAEYIAPVDNATGSAESIEKLRELIENVVKNHLHPEPIPTATLLFYLILIKQFEKRPGWCTLEEATEIAVKCGIEADKVEDILEYLHNNIGTVLHYRDVDGLRNRIICDANKVLKPFNNIFAFVYGADLHQLHKAKHIRSTAEIRPEWMDTICAPSSDIPTSEIVALLENRLILHKKSDGTAYVMPCLLYPDLRVDMEANDPVALKALSPAPLLLVPDTGYVPLGIFTVLTVKLSDTYYFDDKERFRNRVVFFIGEECVKVELRMLPGYIELRHVPKENDASQSSSVNSRELIECREKISVALVDVCKRFAHSQSVNWLYSFYCPHGLQRSGVTGHPATCHPKLTLHTTPSSQRTSPKHVVCSRLHKEKCSGEPFPLENKHKVWFMVSSTCGPMCVYCTV